MKLGGRFRSHLILILGICASAGIAAAFSQQSQAPATASPEIVGQTQAAQGPDAPAVQKNAETPGLTIAADNEEPTTVIRTTTRRVVVNVVVTGPDGKPVPGLTEQNFKVFEDGKPQSVRAFEVHSPELDRSQLPPAPSELPSDTFVNLEPTSASGPPVAVLLDYLNTPVTDQAIAHEQIVRFLEKKPPSTEVAIFALGDSLSMLQGYTTDTGKLLAAMRSKAAGLRMPANSERVQKAQITLDAFLEIGKFLAALDGRKDLLWFSESFDMMVLPNAQDVAQGTLVTDYQQSSPNPGPGVTVTAANMMPSPTTMGATEGSASGFSNVIGEMTSLQEEMRQVAIALAVSQTAVYPIDLRGLATDPGESASAAPPTTMTANSRGIYVSGTPGMPTAPGSAPAAAQQHTDFLRSMGAAQATMTQIADATGGHAFVNTNGLAAAAEKAVSDGATYYTLVYAPSNLNFDGGLRAIHVALDKPDSKLSYRSAYYAVDAGAVTPDAIQSDSLAAAMVHGAPEAQGLLFKAQIDRDGAPAMAAPDSPLAVKAAISGHESKPKKDEPRQLSGMVQTYDIRLSILAQQLQLTETPDGRRHAVLEIAVYAYAADGRKLGGTRQNLEVSVPPAIYERTLQDGLFHKLHVKLPVEAASLRLAILDVGNHQTASLEVALPLPPSAQADVEAPAGLEPAAK